MLKLSFRAMSFVSCALVSFLAIETASAVIIATPATTSGDELAYPASATDLINQGQPSLGATSHPGYTNFSSFSIGGLNDGLLGTASTATPEATFDLDGAWTSEFNLNLLAGSNSLGYTITEIRTIVGWASDRVGQQYTVQYSKIGDPGWTLLDSFSLFTGISGSSQITLTDTTGVIASGVDALQFTIVDPATGTASVYREIDVFGFEAQVPEPSAFYLVGLGMLGLVGRVRRRRATS